MDKTPTYIGSPPTKRHKLMNLQALDILLLKRATPCSNRKNGFINKTSGRKRNIAEVGSSNKKNITGDICSKENQIATKIEIDKAFATFLKKAATPKSVGPLRYAVPNAKRELFQPRRLSMKNKEAKAQVKKQTPKLKLNNITMKDEEEKNIKPTVTPLKINRKLYKTPTRTRTPKKKFNKFSSIPESSKEELNNSNSSNEFLELERRCKAESPLTSLANQMETTSIADSLKKADNNNSTDFARIFERIKQDKQEFDLKFEKIKQDYDIKFEKNMSDINELINKKPTLQVNGKLFKSPKPTKINNLRIATLINQQKATSDSGMDKSIAYYNTIRQTCSLATPKSTRKSLNAPSDSPLTVNKRLSRRIQKQCLMLLDTPAKR